MYATPSAMSSGFGANMVLSGGKGSKEITFGGIGSHSTKALGGTIGNTGTNSGIKVPDR
jgi:hypothetical protein